MLSQVSVRYSVIHRIHGRTEYHYLKTNNVFLKYYIGLGLKLFLYLDNKNIDNSKLI